jgi:CRP-like cAMP-binding protein
MLTGGTRSADVTTETSVELLKMTRADYDRTRSENPQLAMELLEVITIGQANRVRSLSDSLARALD